MPLSPPLSTGIASIEGGWGWGVGTVCDPTVDFMRPVLYWRSPHHTLSLPLAAWTFLFFPGSVQTRDGLELGVHKGSPEKFPPSSPSCLRPSQSSIPPPPITHPPPPSPRILCHVKSFLPEPFRLHSAFNYPSCLNDDVKHRRRESWQLLKMCFFQSQS